MKKLLMSLILLGTFAAMSAKGDSYLYWMVDNATYQVGGNVFFDAVELYAVNTKTGEKSGALGAAFAENYISSESLGSTSERAVSYDVSAYATADWSFIVEAYNGGELPISTSTGISYLDAFNAGAIYEHLEPSGTGIATFSSFAIPEPTSGLLMLFGLCGLALKRKRA